MLYQTTQAHEDLRAKVREFAEAEIKPIAFMLDKENRFPAEAVKKMGELGLMGLPYETEYGGAGLDALSYAIAVEELARVDGALAEDAMEESCALDLQEALEELLGCLARRFDRLNDYRALEHDFLDCLYRSEGVHVWRDAAGVFRASLAGVDEYGQLRLRDEEGRERVYGFKEVTYL